MNHLGDSNKHMVTKTPYTRTVLVSPGMAEGWLLKNKSNRPLRRLTIVKYSRDMINGLWLVNSDCLAFDVEGNLINGQHRLMALILAGVSIEFQVTYDLQAQAGMTMDQGIGRTATDIAHFCGLDTVNKTQTAIAKILSPQRRPSGTEQYSVLIRHLDAIQEVYSWFYKTRRHINIALVMAPIVRAWYSHDHDKLKRFAQILLEGESNENAPYEKTAIILRDFLQDSKVVSGRDMIPEVYGKVERALFAFLNGQRLLKLYKTEDELFPLAGEEV